MLKNKRSDIGRDELAPAEGSGKVDDNDDNIIKSECSSTSRLTSISFSKSSKRTSGSITAKSKLKEQPHRTTPKKRRKKGAEKTLLKRYCSKLDNGTEIKCDNGSYVIVELLGRGGFGNVYKVSKVGSNELYAVKMELSEYGGRKIDRIKIELSALDDIKKFKDASRKNHFVTLVDRGKTDQFKIIVMQLLGPSISDLRRYYICNEFSSTAIRVSQQALQGVWDLHVIGYLHKDIKPQNFAIGMNDKADVIYIIDFGMVFKYIDSYTKEIKSLRRKARFGGTVRYASRNCHRAEQQSRRDDLESWIYMSVELFHSNILPWKRMMNLEAILYEKENFFNSPSQEVYTRAPRDYRSISKYIDKLSYEEEPNYMLLQKALEEIIRNENIDISRPFDWFGYDLTKRRRRKRGLKSSNEKDTVVAQKLSKNPLPSTDSQTISMSKMNQAEAENEHAERDKKEIATFKKSESALQEKETQSSYYQMIDEQNKIIVSSAVSQYFAIT